MNQKFIKSMLLSSFVLTTLIATEPVMAKEELQSLPGSETKIIKFVKAVGFPAGLKAIKTGSTYIAVVWNYPNAVNGKDMYILLEDGHPKTVTIDGKIVLSALDG